jgi:uncharacterized membrane protein YeaQ/YmgE (transglycosylase-associated protein family)
MRNIIEIVIVLCVIVGAYALLALFGVFPQGATMALVLAVVGAFGAFLYGRFTRRVNGPGDGTV